MISTSHTTSCLSVAVLATLVGLQSLTAADPKPIPQKIEFNRDVRPILSDNCFYCHGPDANHRQAELRLDMRDDAIEAGAIAPNNVAASELLVRIESSDPEQLMPPADSHKKLSVEQKLILKKWIEQGAEYQLHWAYEPIRKPLVPTNRHPVDYLVEQKLAEVGLVPSAEADRRTLVRRVYFDLIGLPPSAEVVEQFIRNTSPMAYSELVDSLLSNPHYGERMAQSWLDVVRFADTIGYHSDNPRNVWPYRDWVIQSFNANKPFDRFTLEQIAGDLLPDANQETRIGSAFNRLLLSTEEGGAQEKDYEARMITDRVRAIGTAWLGQTTGCAQCHDHKFDPFTTRDFYSLGAFFADIKEPIIGSREPGMVIVPKDQEETRSKLTIAVQRAREAWDSVADSVSAAEMAWRQEVREGKVRLPELQSDGKASPAEKKTAERVLAAIESNKASPADEKQIHSYFVDRVAHAFTMQRDQLSKAQDALKQFEDGLPRCLVSESSSKKRIVRILPRGNWQDETGEVVSPALPHYLPQPKNSGELNRLDLARWIVSRENPLPSRTVMNRLWKQFFGIALSRVPDDLGAQGELPANAPLLDWLAAEFMDSGWDMKHMVRTIVTSQTYRQTSHATEQQFHVDPYNRYCGRQSPFRLDAEWIRDNALAVSGLLSEKIGGPSVKPYQPDGYWENLNFPTRDYIVDRGESQYRRGLYIWWQRSFLHPSLLAFDAPSREECAAERTRSNIPQQALVLLNDPTYVEASRALASRFAKPNNLTVAGKIDQAYRLVLQRSPTFEEREVMVKLYEQHLMRYRKEPNAANELLKVGFAPADAESEDHDSKLHLAAWTHVARVLLNLHETVTRN